MKIAEAREWVESTYTHKELKELCEPITGSQYVDSLNSIVCDGPLSDLVSSLSKILEEHPKAMLEVYKGWDSWECTLMEPYIVRYESTEECKERLAKQYQKEQNKLERASARVKKNEEKVKVLEQKEREQFERLKKKYGG